MQSLDPIVSEDERAYWCACIMERLRGGHLDFGLGDVMDESDCERLCMQKKGHRRLLDQSRAYRALVLDMVGADERGDALDVGHTLNVFDQEQNKDGTGDDNDNGVGTTKGKTAQGARRRKPCTPRECLKKSAALGRFFIDRYREPQWTLLFYHRLDRGALCIDLYATDVEEAELQSLRDRFPGMAERWRPDRFGVDGADRSMSERRLRAMRTALDRVLAERHLVVRKPGSLPFQYKIGPSPDAPPEHRRGHHFLCCRALCCLFCR